MNAKSSLIFFILLLGMLLSACGGQMSAAQIREDADGYATRSAADQAAQDAAQMRQFKAQDQALAVQEKQIDIGKKQYRADLWKAWQPTLIFVGQVSLGALILPALVMALALAYGSGLTIVGTSKAFVRVLTMYSSAVPVDKETRLPRALMLDKPEPLPEDSFLAKVQERTGIQLVNPRGKQFTAINLATGQVFGRFDVDVPASTRQLEILRQAILVNVYIKRKREKVGSGFSWNGDIINNADGPDGMNSSIIDLDEVLQKFESRFAAVDLE